MQILAVTSLLDRILGRLVQGFLKLEKFHILSGKIDTLLLARRRSSAN